MKHGDARIFRLGISKTPKPNKLVHPAIIPDRSMFFCLQKKLERDHHHIFDHNQQHGLVVVNLTVFFIYRWRLLKKDKRWMYEKLAQIYYDTICCSHFVSPDGPATVYDFSWWSGLTLTDARKAMELIKPNFQSAEVDGQAYWFDTSLSLENGEGESVFFLPAFDEFLISHTARSASLDSPFMKQIIYPSLFNQYLLLPHLPLIENV